MPLRSGQVLSRLTIAGAVACLLVIIGASSPAGAIVRGGADRALLTRCATALLGFGRGLATPVSGSADPALVSQLAVFRRTRSRLDALPAGSGLRAALARTDARTYDPSSAVRLTRSGADTVYAVAAEISAPTLPAGCATLPQFAGGGALLAVRADETGSGPGACLISTRLAENAAPGPPLPGMKRPRPTKALAVTGMACKSQAILSGYTGAIGDQRLGSVTGLALIPDGVGAITYTLADGRHFTAPVAGNLARVPAALSLPAIAHPLSAAELGRLLAVHLPTMVTESSTGTNPAVTLTRPDSLIPDVVRSFSFLKGLVRSGSGVGGSSAGSTGSVSCSARTHGCVAVTVTTACDSHQRCRISRTIQRYRYVGARPPAGTTGAATLPTGPILARTDRRFVRPRRLTFVLRGAPHRAVLVLVSVSCFSRNSGVSSGGPPLQVPVPSRTPVPLPGRARSFQACDVGALVTSTPHGSSPRGPVRVTVTRG